MPREIKFNMICPYPTIDDGSAEAVMGFGPPGWAQTQGAADAQETVVEGETEATRRSRFAGVIVPNGRCDRVDPWEVTGYVIELPHPDGGFVTQVLVRDNSGSCPECGQTGAVQAPKKAPFTGDLKNVTVRLT